MRATMTLALALLALAPQGGSLREAATLAHTQDDTLYAVFNKSYSLSPTGTIEAAEIITEFRRAVLIVREKAGDQSFSDAQLEKAMVPYAGLVTIIVRARLHPMNTFIKEPAYDLYVSTGPTSPPIVPKDFKRDPIYAQGSMGAPLVGVRLEGSFPRADIQAAAAPMLIVADHKADVVWQARLDLARYR